MSKNPLVSICVITYNSSEFIIETLESVKKQTYQNIELIVSDDCSTDDTVVICQSWIKKNVDRFISVSLLTTPVNTGISINCNRAYKAASGEWIKGLAGDDCLHLYCIEYYMDFIKNHPEATIGYSKMDRYANTFSTGNFLDVVDNFPTALIQTDSTSIRQYCAIALGRSVPAPTVIISKLLWEEIGGFNEEMRMCEDWPMWLHVVLSGKCFFYLDSSTVKYRVYRDSVSGKFSVGYLFNKAFDVERFVYNNYIKGKAPFVIRILFLYKHNINFSLNKWGLNKKNSFCYGIYRILMFPYYILAYRYIR